MRTHFVSQLRRQHVILTGRRAQYSVLNHSGQRARCKTTPSPIWTHGNHGRRNFSIDVIPAVLLPPFVFTGLLVTLWTYKCVMMVIFQNKIIYMPNVPPFSRSEKVEDYSRRCQPIVWKEHTVTTADSVKIKLLVGGKQEESRTEDLELARPHVVTIYFQGNASSLPPRLPFLSDGLKAVDRTEGASEHAKHTIVAASYRGYWTSQGRANQGGLELDAERALEFVAEHFSSTTSDLRIVIWGQSIGAGIATIAAARYMNRSRGAPPGRRPPLWGLILETPFTSVNEMLIALYPQKWLPYRYLGIFLRNHLDSRAALRSMGEEIMDAPKDIRLPKVLILQAENDELVPSEHGVELENLCRSNMLDTKRKIIRGALHTEVMARGEGRKAIVDFLTDTGVRPGDPAS